MPSINVGARNMLVLRGDGDQTGERLRVKFTRRRPWVRSRHTHTQNKPIEADQVDSYTSQAPPVVWSYYSNDTQPYIPAQALYVCPEDSSQAAVCAEAMANFASTVIPEGYFGVGSPPPELVELDSAGAIDDYFDVMRDGDGNRMVFAAVVFTSLSLEASEAGAPGVAS